MIKLHKLIKTKLFVWYLIHNLNLAFSFDNLILKREMFIEINKHHLYYLFFVFKWGKWPVLLIFIQWTCISRVSYQVTEGTDQWLLKTCTSYLRHTCSSHCLLLWSIRTRSSSCFPRSKSWDCLGAGSTGLRSLST